MGLRFSSMRKLSIKSSEESMEYDTLNGLYFSKIYVPEELLILILSHLPPKDLIKCSFVCKEWNKLIKSELVWFEKFRRRYSKKPKHLPWYVYYALFGTNFFDKNLLVNTHGEDGYRHWVLSSTLGDGFTVENPPCGSPPLPSNVEDFNKRTGCFATSYGVCSKRQIVVLDNRQIFRKILNEFKPHIYVSEWCCGRFDCSSIYQLHIALFNESDAVLKESMLDNKVEQFSNPQWKKIEIIFDDYPADVKGVIFQHKGKDLLFWKGHYGSKMAGGVVKILFDSITEKKEDDFEDPSVNDAL